MKQKRVFSIAFEGMHQSGKETQIELLKNKLLNAGIPSISIKGEGYRYGTGSSPRDPESKFWKQLNERLKPGSEWNSWEEASYRLARELIVWRDRVLSRHIDKALAPFGVLLVDRSLISKAILKSLQSKPSPEKIFSSEDLYPKSIQKRKKNTVDMVLPDMIIELVAPKEVLLSRLDKGSTEFDFKKRNIEDKYEMYVDAKNHLPEKIRKRIITIDSSATPNEVFEEVLRQITIRFSELKSLT